MSIQNHMPVRVMAHLSLVMLVALVACKSEPKKIDAKKDAGSESGYARKGSSVLPFGWPFLEPKRMHSRGGSTHGGPISLNQVPSEHWLKRSQLLEEKAQKMKIDREAILSLTGSYRVSFQFTETVLFQGQDLPSRPYFSWGTELVLPVEVRDDFISLQHILVMYFQDPKSGELQGPMVMKHWRQDWQYEDRDIHAYQGDLTWERVNAEDMIEQMHWRLSELPGQGYWSQAVFQVDDSPRYETVGKWHHTGKYARFTSENSWRPLPRREFSVRQDYNVLGGIHQITVTDTGWVHQQQNQKLLVKEDVKLISEELGINRYESIAEPDLNAGMAEWALTKDYWAEVRKAWKAVYKKYDRFTLKRKVDDKKLWQHHFEYAGKIIEAKTYDPEAGRKHAWDTIQSFLES